MFFMLIRTLLIRWYEYWEFVIFRSKWRYKNKDNLTNAGTVFPIDKVLIGHHTYGTLNVISYGNKDEKLKIGSYCSIAGQVRFILSGEHNYKTVSSYPFKKVIMNQEVEATAKGVETLVGDDVWIGYGATILSGVHIGQGAVIAARSVVTKDVPAYSIVCGVPAKVIKYRFKPEIIEFLTSLDYRKLSADMISKHLDELYSFPENIELNELKNKLDWFPKKDDLD